MEEYIKMLENCNLLLTDNMTGLSSWITILTVLITVIAAILPFIVTDRQNKFEKETESKFKDFEKETENKIKEFEEKIYLHECNMNNIYNAIAQFYYKNLIPHIDNFSEQSSQKIIISLIDNFLLALYMSKNISLAINCANDIKDTNLYQLNNNFFKENVKTYFSTHPMIQIAEWKDFFRDELKFKIFITAFYFIYEDLEGYPK